MAREWEGEGSCETREWVDLMGGERGHMAIEWVELMGEEG